MGKLSERLSNGRVYDRMLKSSVNLIRCWRENHNITATEDEIIEAVSEEFPDQNTIVLRKIVGDSYRFLENQLEENFRYSKA